MKYAFLYPGQGAQQVGMAKDLYDSYESVQKIFSKADAVLGYSLSELIFSDPQGRLNQTEYTQPALFTVEAAITDVLKDRGCAPSVTMGHSLGEYSALYGAEVFTFEAGLSLIADRGRFMAEAGAESRGSMAAVIGLSSEQIDAELEEIVDGTVVSANRNSPVQTVISGEEAAVQEACELLETAGAKRVVPLKVSGAFHSPLMQPAADRLQKALASVEFNTPICPVISNVTAQAETDPSVLKGLLVDQLLSPVQWVQSEETLKGTAPDVILEVGPGKVIKGLLRAFDRRMKALSCSTVESIEKNC
ncbi:MAG: ACP S-malonyltransferase [Fibrobacterota bacterium]